MTEPVVLTREELSKLVEEGVCNAFTRIGIRADEPIEMQADFQHLREWRQGVQAVKKRGLITLITTLIAGALLALWTGIKAAMHVP